MIFIAPIECILLFVCLIGSRVYTKLTISVSLGLIFRMKLIAEERFRIILGSVGFYGSGIQTYKGGIKYILFRKGKDLGLHDARECRVIKVHQETIKSPIGMKRL